MSEVASTVVAGGRGKPADSGRGVSGTEIAATQLLDQVLTVGDHRFSLPVLSVRDHIPPPEGAAAHEAPGALIGMDVLAGTILAMTPERHRDVWWIVPVDDSQ